MAVSFAGGTDRIAYGAGYNTSFGAISLWMRTSQTTTNAAPLAIWNNSSRFGFGLLLNSGTVNKLRFQGYDSVAARINIQSSASVVTGAWVHVVVNMGVGPGQPCSIWINGAFDVLGNVASGFSIDAASPLHLGDMADAFWPSYVGDLAEVAFWKRNLSGDEIAALAKGFTPHIVSMNSLAFYAPLIRSQQNLFDQAGTTTGTTPIDHPPVRGQ
jgi:hypothetical protein